MPTFSVTVSTNKVNSKCEEIVSIDAEELAEMSEGDIEEYMREVMFDMIEWNFTRID